MDSEYDQKFEEMKKYIPFLESMIKRLENTNNGGNNPRKAQLDKIRSLRDLLQDKKKRMKMENLLKCETVLVNLYAKVEQRDASLDIKKDTTEQIQNEQSDLSVVRSKLKSVSSKLHDEVPETLPEIARATNTEVVCTPGSKEPALFQRRPNKASLSPPHESTSRSSDENLSMSKRHYTRVLLSPEPKKKEWSGKPDSNNDKPLFSRRSPRRSPRRHLSPSYKKERKKSTKRRSKSGQQSEDNLNITLKVPQESLHSLNTKDILSRIIHCSDSDVDIDTLRGLRSQILGELKQTGAKDDISDLILKSYKNKEKRSNLKTPKKNVEVEEGEISDSESEAIENIYGSLVVVNKEEENTNSSKQSSDNQQPRKIQICLVINSDKEKDNKVNEQNPNDTFDITEFEAFTDEKSLNESGDPPEKALDKSISEKPTEKLDNDKSRKESNDKSSLKSEDKQEKQEPTSTIKSKIESNKNVNEKEHDPTQEKATPNNETFKPNFYQPLTVEKGKPDDSTVKDNLNKSNENETKNDNVSKIIEMAKSIRTIDSNVQKRTKKPEVSEIDILQALKKEILGETVPVSISDPITPAMHQPKISKVSSAQAIVSKKRISIENYKQKSSPSVKQPLFAETYRRTSKDDSSKKQSLKLTEKECERFNLPSTLSHDDTDDEDKSGMSVGDIYGNLAPKSPDHEDFADTGIKPPVIIPSDPVKNVVVNSKVDVDMRTLMSVGSPVPFGGRKNMTSPLITSENIMEQLRSEKSQSNESVRKSIADRVRTEAAQSVPNESTNSYLTNFDRLPRSGVNYPNITPDKSPNITSNIPPLMSLQIGPSGNPNICPNIPSSINPIMTPILNPLQLNASMASNIGDIMTPILTPNINPSMTPSRNPVMVPVLNAMMTQNPMMTPIMTPNARSYEMTPCQNFDNDDYTNQKHVYAPMFPTFEQQEYLEKDSHNKSRWDANDNPNWEDRNCRNPSVQKDLDYQRHRNDRYKRGMDSPQIRMDCPSTPIPSFGRMETPMTPVHPFGRSDCPMTPNHSFGRSECPMTPSHPFGRSECPMTPSHPFGRSDSIMTPTNAFGRDDYHNTSTNKYNKSQDPRLNRSSNYDKYQNRNEERNRYFKDNRSMSNNNDKYRRYQDNSYDQSGRNDRDRMSRRESGMGHSLSRDYDNDQGYHGEYFNNDYRYRNEKSKTFEDPRSQRNYRARSIGRMNPSDDNYSPRGENSKSRSTREGSIEKPISVQSHSGRSFNIDTSFNRTFQASKSPSRDMSFDARRQRASSVGRCLRDSPREDLELRGFNDIKSKTDNADSRAMNFRRACSVGRDIKDYDANRNFKDVKADLRSSNFDYLDKKSQNRNDKSKTSAIFPTRTNESQSYRDSRSKSRDYGVRRTKNDESSKYSPNKNYRDPRVRREIKNQTSGNDKYKDRDKSQGSPHYKNHGIVYSNDNIAKGTILASAAGVKNFKIPKIKRPVEENEVENVSKVNEVARNEVIAINDKKVDNSNIVQLKNSENKEVRSESPAYKRRNKDKSKEQATVVVEDPKSKSNSTSSTKKEEKSINQLTEPVSSDSDSSFTQSERRITRSVRRSQIKPQICKESNEKRSKRIKKPIIYDSDSDSQVGDNINKNTEQNINDLATKEKPVETGKESGENDSKKQSAKTNDKEDSAVDDKNIPTITNELSEIQDQTNTLDVSFGTDEEMFSDNIASGSVLENIKALIADLDNDIEAPKINDFNDKFISNIISNNNSPIPLEVNESDFVSDMLISQKMDFGNVDYTGKNDSERQNLEHTKEKSDTLRLSKIENDVENIISDLNNSENKIEILKDSKEKKENDKKESNMIAAENLEKSSNEDNEELRDKLNNLNNEAIVSTTALEEKSDEIPKDTQNTPSSTHATGDSSHIPDTTFNSNVANNDSNKNKGLQESIPDSTNEITPEMNSDITSTRNSADKLPMELSDAQTSCADNVTRIESIGKFLSLLEDKNKLLELLSLLGKDSGENEKIKKKLEKLSEIVADNEETTNVDFKNNDGHKQHAIENEGQKNDVDSSTDKSLQSSNKNESDVDYIHDKKMVENNTSCVSQELDSGKEQNEINKDISKKQNAVEDKQGTEHKKEKGSVENKNDSGSINNELVEPKTVQDVHQDVIEKTNNEDGNVSLEIPNQLSKGQSDNEIGAQIKFGGKTINKTRYTKKGRFAKKQTQNKRVTRSNGGTSPPIVTSAPKKPSRELLKLQEDIREMFISEDVLNATGIRMCRLAKMVDEKNSQTNETEPIVVLEKIKGKNLPDETLGAVDKTNKKKNSKIKPYAPSEGSVESESKEKTKYKPGPKSKTKKNDDDPYAFETESLGESSYTVDSKDHNSESDSDSGDSVKSSESNELLVELKKKAKPAKRKRPGWKVGIIRKKNGKKKKPEAKNTDAVLPDKPVEQDETNKDNETSHDVPDLNCFTDKSYCFNKNVKIFSCRLCGYSGDDIVPHYKKQHPHSEIPLSRLNPATAKEAIAQCEEMNLQAVSKIRTKKYVCRFCFKEFVNNNSNTALETFFWHVVSVHTGEYKQLCSECINVTRCPFNLDIPPPPKNLKGQLIGYICGRCNFTQVSLENLKTHVIVRHDDKQTEVFSINLADISRKVLKSLLNKTANETTIEAPRVLRSSRSSQSLAEQSDDRSDVTESTDRVPMEAQRNDPIKDINISPMEASKDIKKTKFTFETEYMSDTSSYSQNDEIIKAGIKLERDDDENHHFQFEHSVENPPKTPTENVESSNQIETIPYSDVLNYPHFKIKLSSTGTKEYMCCINGDYHYKTTLLISLKKHVQLKHVENWDGYCFVCKVIVTSQGVHKFQDCLQHFVDKHIDNFPVLNEDLEPISESSEPPNVVSDAEGISMSNTYINVRPISDLISSDEIQSHDGNPSMPKIQSVVSLGAPPDHVSSAPEKIEKIYKYEESQAEIMSKKHRIVLDTMLSHEKLVQVFKCAGRFCSYTTDNLEEALDHASTHEKIGGENSLKCAYCDFDPMGNAIDLVTHVFKSYSYCSYACSKCFYRAPASQLVHAHIKRVHTQFDANTVPVLCPAAVVKDNSEEELIPRDQAVLHYECTNADPEAGGTCQFKTYVVTKFRDHLQSRHANDQEFSCFMCNTTTPSPEHLIHHLKSHGLRLYQCCRCLFGGDTEPDMLAHASELHPVKPPKAYLRIITAKGSNGGSRVLPLASLTKTVVQTTVVTPSADKDNPVKQAERSIDLEKLIGHTNLQNKTNTTTIEPTDVSVNEAHIQLESQQTSDSDCLLDRPHESTSPAVLTLLKEQDTVSPLTNVKTEPVETETTENIPEAAIPQDPDVVCLDSDEDCRQNVIDLSSEDVFTADQSKLESDSAPKVPRSRLYKCSRCLNVNKNEATFKRHLPTCYPGENKPIPCAHCSYTAPWTKIVDHYTTKHWKSSNQYPCSLCSSLFVSQASVKRHMRIMHDGMPPVATKDPPYGVAHNIVDGKRQVTKRKMSDELTNVSSEPATKLKKYGPEDVDRLPINPILDNLVHCSLCEFSTKVRLNMVRHLQLHAEQQPVPRTAPVNPVPHLETNEKHFDKMVNLASSSATLRHDKVNKDGISVDAEHISPEAAAIYPKYVQDRLRYTCGAKGCSYISVNESMFKFHWDTLHYGTNDYHCVHCPPHQHLDTTKPLTAVRIIAHLKMHDAKLYACSLCSYYHHTRKVMDKHFKEVHKGKLIIVREDGITAAPTPPVPQPVTSAPTMDLKPWQCGLCSFKSMLRPEVIDHCGKSHQSKMQFKCTYCGFRTSNIENISKHQSKQHPGKKEEVFYFYYREGSIPDEADGTAHWQKQSQKTEPGIKTESNVSPPSSSPTLPKEAPPKPTLNLDIVKKEVIEPEITETSEVTMASLCKKFGPFCDPNGLKYKCPLCKVVSEEFRDAMQSHLYEELQYRKWGCSVCSYKAFHQRGLQQHVETEHRYSRDKPVALQVDWLTEMWVETLLDHQMVIIEKNKENLEKQKVEILRSNPRPSKAVVKPPEPPKSVDKPNISMAELERLFGPFGVPYNMHYCCPKCSTTTRVEAVMQQHLESELDKIRWSCKVCNENSFLTYHEAQFHCRSKHQGQFTFPVEVTRDVGLRAAWVAAVLRVQKLSMNYMPVKETESEAAPPPDNVDNSLLVERYAETIPTPEEQMKINRKSDSDDDRLVIDETQSKKSTEQLKCRFCSAVFTLDRYYTAHVLKHYGLKPFTCPYCPYSDLRKQMECHMVAAHAGKALIYQSTPIPTMPPAEYKNMQKSLIGEHLALVCFVCDKAMTTVERKEHFVELGKKGDVVIKCCHCTSMYRNIDLLVLHHNQNHPEIAMNYLPYVLNIDSAIHWCFECDALNPFLKDFRGHCVQMQSIKRAKRFDNAVIEIDEEETGGKRKADDNTIVPIPKRVAKKSTTKLPDVMSVARKSTTKLPFDVPCESEEYSYYGTKPDLDNLDNVTTLMPFCNTMVPFSLKKLSEIIKIYPLVVVKDINK